MGFKEVGGPSSKLATEIQEQGNYDHELQRTGPGTGSAISLNKKLSRSLSFAINDDADLTQAQDEPEAITAAGDHSDFILLSTVACLANNQRGRWKLAESHKNLPRFARIMPLQVIGCSFSFYSIAAFYEEDESWLCSANSIVTPSRHLSYTRVAMRQAVKPRPGSATESADDLLEYWLHVDFNQTKLTIDVRWPRNRVADLKLPIMIENQFVKTFWANCANPMSVFAPDERKWIMFQDQNVQNFKVPDTFDIIPCEQLIAPFSLKLYDYQLRTLAWMQGIEDGEESLFYAPNVVDLTASNTELGNFEFLDLNENLNEFKSGSDWKKEKTVKGGIIADKPGVGKTITTLALCHTRPFDQTPEEYQFSLHAESGRFISKATLILAPNNIVNQWAEEVHKCFGDSASVIQIKGKNDLLRSNLHDILISYDYVVVSYQLLINGCYKGRKPSGRYLSNYGKNFNFEDSTDREKFVAGRKSDYAFTWIHFHRMVCDEFHEVTDKSASIRSQVKEMTATYQWGLTGTPRLETSHVVKQFADFLDLNADWTFSDLEAMRFIQHRVRRNEPVVSFPAPEYQAFKVGQTAVESAFYRSCTTTLSVVDLLKLCNHYQIGNAAANLGMHNALSIEAVTALVQNNRLTDIKNFAKSIEDGHKSLLDLEERREKVPDDDNEQNRNKIRDINNKIRNMERDLANWRDKMGVVQAQFNFFENFLNSYLAAEGNKVECNICLDEDIQGDIGIIPCGHAFCWDCAQDAVRTNGRCPNCREQIGVGAIMKVLPPSAMKAIEAELEAGKAEIDEIDLESQHLDPNMFGSKIREVVKYLKEETAKSENYRFIVFIQFSDLADLVSAALKTYGITTVRLARGWQQRERALRLFRAGLTPGVDATSGLSSNPSEEIPTVNSRVEPVLNVKGKLVFDEPDSKSKGKRKAEVVFGEEPPAAKVTKLEHVSSTGDKEMTENSPKSEKPVKVLMLSARDSVSGLNLTEASHCIVLHPFHSHIEAYAIASEKQGVARVLRNGQTKVVKIVRFYVENTVEAEMHANRVAVHQTE
ncbi:DNA helicase rad5 [Physocladia obscura]|uniref:DNA helicase rad5 n=1 Tax=Physocladia obscura TaxID=109957 RepID=A0AAD5XBD2_9FUNG|nr:DNA helicase rad5 [Physocladia obscura]